MSEWTAWISPVSSDSSSVVPPASVIASRGCSSSGCSTPSAARMAMVLPFSSLAMIRGYPKPPPIVGSVSVSSQPGPGELRARLDELTLDDAHRLGRRLERLRRGTDPQALQRIARDVERAEAKV